MSYGREPRRETIRDAGREQDKRRARGQSPAKTGPQWWVERWQRWVKEMAFAADAGLAESARIKRLEIGQGVVTAIVQDRSQELCQVEIRMTPWSQAQWQAALDAIGAQAHCAAQLLGGELPTELDAVLAEAGAPLLPVAPTEVEVVCLGPVCARGACHHAALIFAQLGEALADDPWLLLRMRGRDQTQVLAALRRARAKPADSANSSTQAPAPTSAGRFHRNPADATSPEETPPLAAQMTSFWGVSKALEGYRPHFNEPKVDAVLLRRLGPLPFSGPDDDIYEDLATIYRRVSSAALRAAFAPDSDQDQ